jgi:hypothetical protein
MPAPLPDAEIDRFRDQGYLVRDGWLEPDLCRAMIDEIDQHEVSGRSRPAYAFPIHGMLTSHPPLMDLIRPLLGRDFLFHHVHASRHDEGAPGVAWHNDYEQVPQLDRTHAEVIVLVYPDGLRGEVGDLALVPGTQGIVCDWYALSVFGTAPLPGEVVIDRLAPGAIVIAHTGLLHCRRPRPGPGRRYFSDFSFCQRGPRWPSWSEGDWRAMYPWLRQAGCDRGGRYAHLYDESQFFDQRDARTRLTALAARGFSELLTGMREP